MKTLIMMKRINIKKLAEAVLIIILHGKYEYFLKLNSNFKAVYVKIAKLAQNIIIFMKFYNLL